MYTVLVSKKATKDLQKLPLGTRKRIGSALKKLEKNPYPEGRKKLKGTLGDYWRIRTGNFIYEIQQDQVIVYVLRVLDRKEAYRR